MKQSIYYFIDKFQRNEIEKLNRKISIVYRNYKKKPDIDEIKSLVRFCKNQFRKVYICLDPDANSKTFDIQKSLGYNVDSKIVLIPKDLKYMQQEDIKRLLNGNQ